MALDKPPFGGSAQLEGAAFTHGHIEGHPVPCLSADLQFTLHTGYQTREVDASDVALLRAHLNHVST